MTEGEKFPKDFDIRQPPATTLKDRIAIASVSPMENENDKVSFCLYFLNSPSYTEDVKKISDEEKLFLFDLTTQASSVLINKLKGLILYTKDEVFGVKSITDELKEANQCVKYLRQFEMNLLLDNKQKILLNDMVEKLKKIEQDNE